MDKWHVKYLSESNEEAITRVSLMHHLSSISPIFPELKFEIENKNITQYAKHIDDHKWPENLTLLRILWEDFQTAIFDMHQLGYVHGDILKKNIVYDGTRLRLIDHELVLFHKNHLRATYPWIASEDYIAKQLTSKTDLICLKATELRLFDECKYKEFRIEQMNMLSPFYTKFIVRKLKKP
jgi:hypothetical protein